MADLAGPIESSDPDMLTPVPVCLVGKHGNKPAPSGIRYSAGVGMSVVCEQLLHIQILGSDDAVPPDDLGRKFLVMIISEITDPLMQPGSFSALDLIAVAALCFSGQQALLMFQALHQFGQRLRIRDMSQPVRNHGKVRKAKVDAYRLSLQEFLRFIAFTQDGYVILSGRHLFNRGIQDPSFDRAGYSGFYKPQFRKLNRPLRDSDGMVVVFARI